MTDSTQIKIPQEAFDWYDEYAHGDIDRRTFMSRLATLAGAGISMSLLTSALIPNYALAEQVSFNDADIIASFETFESPDGHLEGRGYLVKPSKLTGKAAAVQYARQQEQARVVSQLGVQLFCCLVILDRIECGQRGVGPTMADQQFASRVAEVGKIRIG